MLHIYQADRSGTAWNGGKKEEETMKEGENEG